MLKIVGAPTPDLAGIAGVCVGVDHLPRRSRSTASRNRADVQAGLTQIIEGEILPRLARAHREDRRARASMRSPTPERLAAFAHALMRGDPHDEWVPALLEEGLPLDALLLDLFAPAARHLGRLWEEDEANFLDVAVALGHLRSLAHALCARLEGAEVPTNGRRILLMPCPGETHLFNLALVASFFREAGWNVVVSSGENEDPVALVHTERFDLVGISLSCDVLLPVMSDLVAKLRAASCNPGVRVMVGGPLFLREPACAAIVGADTVAQDGRSAVKTAEALFAR